MKGFAPSFLPHPREQQQWRRETVFFCGTSVVATKPKAAFAKERGGVSFEREATKRNCERGERLAKLMQKKRICCVIQYCSRRRRRRPHVPSHIGALNSFYKPESKLVCGMIFFFGTLIMASGNTIGYIYEFFSRAWRHGRYTHGRMAWVTVILSNAVRYSSIKQECTILCTCSSSTLLQYTTCNESVFSPKLFSAGRGRPRRRLLRLLLQPRGGLRAAPLRDGRLPHRARGLRRHRGPRRRRQLPRPRRRPLRAADEEHHQRSHTGEGWFGFGFFSMQVHVREGMFKSKINCTLRA